MIGGSLVNIHFLRMIGYIEKLSQLGFVTDLVLNVDLVLQSLPQRFLQYIMKYHMNKLDNTLLELLKMLKTIERALKKKKSLVLLV